MEDILKDKRFAHVGKDPRFRSLQKNQRKVKIDNRFQEMFQDERFKLKYSVDKRGRPVKTTTNENLQKYYELTSEESDDSDCEESPENTNIAQHGKNKTKKEVGRKKTDKKTRMTKISQKNQSSKKNLENNTVEQKKITGVTSSDTSTKNNLYTKDEEFDDQVNQSSNSESDNESLEKKYNRKIGSEEGKISTEESEDDSDSDSEVDYARGGVVLESSSEEEQESTDVSADEDEEEFDHKWGEIDKEAPEAEEITSRLALCNVDWDRIKANDLMVLLNSFKPSSGNIKSVHVYPSEFGKERMKEEEVKGPSEIVDNKKETSSTDKNEESEYHTEKLRQYQLNRLKYYYAVIECDSVETANHIYENCDGMEYETTGNRLDLRFIPKEMTFDDEPKSVATDVPNAAIYKPTIYSSTALQQSTVQCTWDETDQDRIALTMRKFDKDDLEEMDLKDYLASDSDVEEENPYGDLVDNAEFGEVDSGSEGEEAQIEKYRNLLKNLGGTAEKEDKDMEMEVTWEPGLKETTEKLIKKKTKEKTLTPWEQYLEKKKDKKKKRKGAQKNEPKMAEEENNSESDDVPSDVDLNDPYFQEEYKAMKTGTDKKTEKKKKHKKKLSPEELKEKEEREAELKLLLMDDEDQRQHFNLKQLMETDKKKKKRKKMKKREEETAVVEDNFKLDMEDPRFNVLFENPHYNIDPSAPEFKKTKAMNSLIEEKLNRKKNKREKGVDRKKDFSENIKRKSDNDSDLMLSSKKSKSIDKDIELASLVKSVKSRTKIAKSKRKL